MAKNFIQEGKRIEITASGAAISSGDLVLVNDLAVVALVDIADGDSGNAAPEGVWELSGKAAEAVNQGDKLYWDADGDPLVGTAGTGCITATPTDNQYIGIAWAAAAADVGTVPTKLNA